MQDVPEIGTPRIEVKEGSLVSGYGENFEVSFNSGTPSFSMPVQAPKLRDNAPALALSYGGTRENGPFGVGFSLDVASVSRLTDKGIPRYSRSDRFALSGSKLTPHYDLNGDDWVADERQEGDYTVIGYRERVETGNRRIEWWQHDEDGTSFWKVVDADNATTLYGADADSRIADPAAVQNIFQWLISERIDAKGNRTVYGYKREDGAGLPPGDRLPGPQLYLQSVRYGNYRSETGDERFAVEVLFDYGEYELPSLTPVRPWPVRRDPFSSHRPGFKLCTWRLCRNILTVHHFPDEVGVGSCLTGVLALNYDETPYFSMLTSAQRIGWRKEKSGRLISEAMPAMRFGFGGFDPAASRFTQLEVPDLPPIPGLPGRDHYQFVDLYGDGIPGVLYNNTSVLAYWRALGEGRYEPPLPPKHFPSDSALAEGRCVLMDVAGNGHKDLVVQVPQRSGFYRNNNDGSWETFVPFAGIAPEMTEPGMLITDLSGSGRQDLMIEAAPDRIRVYASHGTRGFDPPVLRAVVPGFAAAPGQDEREVVTFADVFGDGLQHRVRLTDGKLTVWPTLGYGRFGAPVTFANVPRFGEALTSRRVFFADITGSGYDDLIFVYSTHLAIHRNESGNAFSDPLIVAVPFRVNDLDTINWADVFGDGQSAFVVSKAEPQVVHHALSFATGEKPYLLATIDNGYGAETRLTWRSSTHFQLADRRAGRPWATPLNMVVQVVDTVAVTDATTGLVSIRRYQYADGYFDPVEREFRGFAYVQSQDSQTVADDLWHFPAQRAVAAAEEGLEPCLARYWYNTGAAVLQEARSVPLPGFKDAPLVPPDVLSPEIFAIGGDTVREAYWALKDHEAATSVTGIGENGIPKPVAYQTSAQNYLVTLLQPRIGDSPAAFRVTQRQSRSTEQDGSSEEARVTDGFNLALDAFGNVLRSASIAYPRRPVGGEILPPQQKTLIVTATQNAFVNHPDTAAEPFRYIGLQYEERVLEISGLDTTGAFLDFTAVDRAVVAALEPAAIIPYGLPFTPGALQARPFQWTRNVYWNGAQSAPLPLGQIAAPGLLYEQHMAVFPEAFVTDVFGTRVEPAMLEALNGQGAGYVLADGYWWNPDARRAYGDAATWYSPISTTDPFGAVTVFGYDRYFLQITSVIDALGQTIEAEIDYQALQPFRVTDINGNSTETVYGPLGTMVAVSHYGTILDEAVGDRPLTDYVYTMPAGRAEILADPEKFLQGAGSYHFIDFFAFSKGGGPVYGISIEADRAERPADAAWQPEPRRISASLAFVDGSLRPLARLDRVDAAALIEDAGGDGAADDAFVVTGQVAYDERGQPIKRYNPFVVAKPDFVPRPDAPFTRDSYDALGRLVRSDTPPGFFSRIEYHAWERVVFDENDTVTASPYYKTHIGNTGPAFADEHDALLKAAVFDGTPTTFLLDPLGRDILERRIEVFADPGDPAAEEPATLETGTWRDIAGAVTALADPRFYAGAATSLYNQVSRYDMAGKPVSVTSSDRGKDEPGTQLMLGDALGNPLYGWDNKGTRLRHTYDTLRRPVGLFVTSAGPEFEAESFVYGTDAAFNTRGRVVISRDQAGEGLIAAYSLTGEPTEETRRFPAAYGGPIDWSDPDKVRMLADEWQLGAVYNRRGWPLAIINADGSVEISVYYCNGWLKAVSLADSRTATPCSVMTGRRYSAAGVEAETRLANGVATVRRYDPDTLRLAAITTTRDTDQTVLQDDAITYDPVGNVTRIRHNVDPDDYWNNALTEPLSDYTYDSLYRLRIAKGRQQAGLAAPDALRVPGLGAGDDPTRLVAYTERYDIDRSGNLIEIRHAADGGAGQGSWTRSFAVSPTSNHAVPTETATGLSPDDFYDLSGNLTRLPNLAAITFDERNHMASAVLVARSGADDDAEFYRYDAGGQRRRKTLRRLDNGGTTLEDTLYIGNLILIRRTRITDGTQTVTGEGSCLSVRAGQERLAVIDRDDAEPTPQWRYQLDNKQSSVTIELDEAGLLITYEEYFPYGGTALAKGRSQLDLDIKRYRFTGRERDQATGLYHIGMRTYIPSMGRWLTPDPAGTIDGPNLYAYVGANPTTYTDPSGLMGKRAEKKALRQQQEVNGENSAEAKARGEQEKKTAELKAQERALSNQFKNWMKLWEEYPNEPIWWDPPRPSIRSPYPLLANKEGPAMGEGGTVLLVKMTEGVEDRRARDERGSVIGRLQSYLLHPYHEEGGPKAKFFREALGFYRSDAYRLADQIKFDSTTATLERTDQYGTRYSQMTPITGVVIRMNEETRKKTMEQRTAQVTFIWMRDIGAEFVRLLTAIPPEKVKR
ncbi:hypothetical protein ATN84_24890 [Paramesorhizobium deserti]|uniref:Insecticide toxin TcdB middle/N-terminal domain-containing protein n=1 Tax=Paramesorhizobium deserti TaxID=1494590 RepID=A0A135HXH8_9HYPH|nr:SpvB/TcaC N-terminal domain-containing protein [Paramesorhizobium deserti]KXF77916.1 hypothetical protein ATN84_24890 [Paramesorhizobium deserti]